MEPCLFRQAILVLVTLGLVTLFALVALVWAVEDEDKKEVDKKRKGRTGYVLIPAYFGVACAVFRALRKYDLPGLSIIEFLKAIIPAAPKISCPLSRMAVTNRLHGIQVWLFRQTPSPDDLLGLPRRESEAELNDEVEQQETVTGPDTEQRRQESSSQAITSALSTRPTDQLRRSRRHPRVFSTPPVRDSLIQGAVNPQDRRQRCIEDFEARTREVRNDPALMLVRGSLDNLLREYHRVTEAGHRQAPVPDKVRYAIRLQTYIHNLEFQIQELGAHPGFTYGRMNILRHELRAARAARERLGPIAQLHPAAIAARRQILRPAATPAQRQIQNPAGQLPTSSLNTAMGFGPVPTRIQNAVMAFQSTPTRTGGTAAGFGHGQTATPGMPRSNLAAQASDTLDTMNGMDRFHRLVTQYLESRVRAFYSRSDIRDVEAFRRDVTALNRLLRGLSTIRVDFATSSLGPTHPITQRLVLDIQNIDTSRPTIIASQMNVQATRTVIESSRAHDDPDSLSISEGGRHGGSDRSVIEGSTTNGLSNPYLAIEEQAQPSTQHQATADINDSVSDHTMVQVPVNSAAQRSFEFQEPSPAETTRQTASYYGETCSSSETASAAYGLEAQNADDPSSASAIEDADDDDEELYTDAY